MIRQLANSPAVFKTKDMQWTSRFYIEKSTKKEMTIIVHGLDKLDGGTALYDSKEYNVKFIKHLQMVGIGVSQQYKYVLTRSYNVIKVDEGMEKLIREGNHIILKDEHYEEGDYYIEDGVKWVIKDVKKTKEGFKYTLNRSE